MMPLSGPSTPRLRGWPICWIGGLLLVALALGSQLRVSYCAVGCGGALVPAAGCCGVEVAPAASCCGCCAGAEEPAGKGAPSAAGYGHAGGECDGGAAPGEGHRPSGRQGCLVTVCFDVELAPASEPLELQREGSAATPPPAWADGVAAVRRPWRVRPFERGPPRIDRRTALRASTLLLI